MDELKVSLSALQHYIFCPRQCALIHNENIWHENYLTASGRQLHERVDSGTYETRSHIRIERSVEVSASTLGLVGKLDVLEIDKQSSTYTPVEYKRGKPKPNLSDKVQLCAQALCLEEMLNIEIENGALWYWQIRSRIDIVLDKELRQSTLQIINQTKQLFASGDTPKAVYEKKCDACSLYDTCNPKLLTKDRSSSYVEKLFQVE